RDLHLVAAGDQQLDQRPEDERMSARSHVDPDPHRMDRRYTDDAVAEPAIAIGEHVGRSGESLRDLRVTVNALDVTLVPERERKQPPELAREVLATCGVVVEETSHHGRLEVALPSERLGRERLTGKGLELSTQPGGRGNRET